MSESSEKAIRIKRANEKAWLEMESVSAVGVGMEAGKPAIIISVKKRTSGLEQKFPQSIEGVPVVIRESGEIRAQ